MSPFLYTGIEVRYYRNEGEVHITGLTTYSDLCVRIEMSYDDGESWEPHGHCHSVDGIYFILEDPKEARVQTQVCGVHSNLCGDFQEAGIIVIIFKELEL